VFIIFGIESKNHLKDFTLSIAKIRKFANFFGLFIFFPVPPQTKTTKKTKKNQNPDKETFFSTNATPLAHILQNQKKQAVNIETTEKS